MAITASISHLTHYTYDKPVFLSPQVVRLRPAPHSRTRVVSHSLKVSPATHFVNHQQDLYGNWLSRFVFQEPVRELKLEVDLVADMTVYNPFDFFVDETAETFPFDYPDEIVDDLTIYRRTEAAGTKLAAFLSAFDKRPRRTIDVLVDLNAAVHRTVGYVIRMEPGVQPPETTLEAGVGSCRDSSWLLVQALRHLGFAARFVSGYLIQLKPDIEALDGPSGTDVDFTDLHAWTEVYLPGAGWIGLDPTSGLLTGESHVPLAATPHYGNAAPIVGSFSAAGEVKTGFHYDMKVTRIAEKPRVTKPYSDEAWHALDALGHKVDAAINAADMRLTMGGEPTFVSIDDFEADEWNGDAIGPTKRTLADRLIRRLRDRFARGGFLHHGQGKWYPGETLPRWTFSLYWRRDGAPIWTDAALVAREDAPTQSTAKDAERYLLAMARRLDVDPDNVLPAYEDPAQWILREADLPINVTPEDPKLRDPEARERIARVFSRGLGQPAGYALPIQAWQGADRAARWRSERWRTRRGHLFLVPGDSPVGYRLPLSALPFVPPTAYPHVYPQDPFVQRGPLPDLTSADQASKRTIFDELERIAAEETARLPAVTPGRHQPVHGVRAAERRPDEEGHGSDFPSSVVRTALAVEPRDGNLCVFMPPVETLEDYLALIAVAEDTARALNLPVQIEGYAPPHDPRINAIKVAPDPGVIEVNVQPAHSWDECKDITTGVYEEARASRLSADKYMIDGKHTGTGGGNHVVVGAATPEASPFLRRPDILRSLILYWQRHPSLSYLFSGLFIGPTSQAPRIDEARHDSLYELEIALTQIPDNNDAAAPPPWLADRLLRNILVDVTGNTHRSDICIDKLFSPDGPTGRLGLVEFRGFEMPPDARMSLAQQLLIRALMVMFWNAPITGWPVRWGTQLHDRFMLPHFIWQDFLEVLRDLEAHGFAMRAAWYEAQYEFRFPFYGDLAVEGMHLELRQALEPWPALGERGFIGGTVRYTDSSVERLQVKLTAADPNRYIIACNRRRVPMTDAGNGASVGGVRFKAWQPADAMHPMLAVAVPLTFDLFDTWSGRAIGGCTYHVAHPGGRAYDTFPVNGNEAQARRLSRFEKMGHSAGAYWPCEERPHPEFPMTLDLRRAAGV